MASMVRHDVRRDRHIRRLKSPADAEIEADHDRFDAP
jgi:hypothetical protein